MTPVTAVPTRIVHADDELEGRAHVRFASGTETDVPLSRIAEFVTVLRCRYPTVQDMRSPHWAKRGLSAMASWRYRWRRYGRPWELDLANKLVRLRVPQVSGL